MGLAALKPFVESAVNLGDVLHHHAGSVESGLARAHITVCRRLHSCLLLPPLLLLLLLLFLLPPLCGHPCPPVLQALLSGARAVPLAIVLGVGIRLPWLLTLAARSNLGTCSKYLSWDLCLCIFCCLPSAVACCASQNGPGWGCDGLGEERYQQRWSHGERGCPIGC